jgi:hypothetical protein
MMRYNYIIVGCIILVGIALIIGVGVTTHSNMTVMRADKFSIPACVKYLEKKDYPLNYLKDLKLGDFVDARDLRDSFRQVLLSCKKNNVDHLLIAYLPIYFVELRKLLKNDFTTGCTLFLKSLGPQIQKLLTEVAHELQSTLPVTLIMPPAHALARVPIVTLSSEDRVRYLIKQFPLLDGIDYSNLETLTIINNQGSEQNTGLIDYLRYEYLYNKPLTYRIVETDKKHFHKYLE